MVTIMLESQSMKEYIAEKPGESIQQSLHRITVDEDFICSTLQLGMFSYS